MVKKVMVSMFAATMILASSSQVSFATSNAQLTTEVKQTIMGNLSQMGVDQATQAKLIAKLERGELWDSMNPAYQEEAEKHLKVSPMEPKKMYYFPDGSPVQASLDGGTSSCGTGYCTFTGVKVTRFTSIVSASFLANYTIVSGDSNADYISNIYESRISVVGGTYNNASLTVTIPKEYIGTNRYAAQATQKFDVTFYSGSAASTYYLKLFVGQDIAWQDANW